MILDDWENAKTVWYFEVWQEPKEEANVIDYNINWEQTKDEFAKLNANNQTTTGMANTIPWVNAPKLLADTSIIWGEWGGWWWGGWWSTASYSQLTIASTAALPASDVSYFDNLSVDITSPDVTLNDNKTYINLAEWIYIIYIMLNIHKSWTTFDFTCNYYYPDWNWDRLIKGTWSWSWFNTYFSVYKSDWTWFIRLWINPTTSISNFTDSFIRIVKVW